jgi:adenosylmethionine-8-amino-7-oxononanoate aminotransferase
VRVLGGVAAIELVSDKTTKDAGGYLDQIGRRLYPAFLERGLLLRPLGNVLYFMPPYVITDAEADWVMTQITDVVESLRSP